MNLSCWSVSLTRAPVIKVGVENTVPELVPTSSVKTVVLFIRQCAEVPNLWDAWSKYRAVGFPTKSISTTKEAFAARAVDNVPGFANAVADACTPTMTALVVGKLPGCAVAVAWAVTPITNGAFTPGPVQAEYMPVNPDLAAAATSPRAPGIDAPELADSGPT